MGLLGVKRNHQCFVDIRWQISALRERFELALGCLDVDVYPGNEADLFGDLERSGNS